MRIETKRGKKEREREAGRKGEKMSTRGERGERGEMQRGLKRDKEKGEKIEGQRMRSGGVGRKTHRESVVSHCLTSLQVGGLWSSKWRLERNAETQHKSPNVHTV